MKKDASIGSCFDEALTTYKLTPFLWKILAKPCLFFNYFRPLLIPNIKYSFNFNNIIWLKLLSRCWELGIWTRGLRMVSADETMELWRLLNPWPHFVKQFKASKSIWGHSFSVLPHIEIPWRSNYKFVKVNLSLMTYNYSYLVTVPTLAFNTKKYIL